MTEREDTGVDPTPVGWAELAKSFGAAVGVEVAEWQQRVAERLRPLAASIAVVHAPTADEVLTTPDVDEVLREVRRAATRLRAQNVLPAQVRFAPDVADAIGRRAEEAVGGRLGDLAGLKLYGLDVVPSTLVPPGTFVVMPADLPRFDPLRLDLPSRERFDPFAVARYIAAERMALAIYGPRRRRTWPPAQQRAAHTAYRAKTRRRNRRRR